MSYDPNSADAMFSRVLQRLDQQDLVLHEIKEQVVKTNGRVDKLETWKLEVKAKTALISSAISTGVGLVTWYLTKER